MSDYDALVLGAGLAGLTAAATLIDGGARVLVLEKTVAGGGSTAMSGGWFAWSGTPEQRARGIADDDETFVRDMRVTGGGRADPQLLDAFGERVVDESRTYKEIGTAALDQPGAIGFQVFDQQVRDRSRPGVPLSDIADLESRGPILRADSLPDLAREAGINANALVRTVDRYNDSSMKDDVGRTSLCNGTGTPIPLVDPPFYAYPSRPLMTSTFGGVRVSPATDVLNHQGLPIPGLFAAGEVTGGFHGSSYLTGTALGKALIFGRRAGSRILAGL